MLGGLNVTMLNLSVHVQNRHDDTFWQWQLVHGLIYLHFTKHILNTPQRKCALIERVQSAFLHKVNRGQRAGHDPLDLKRPGGRGLVYLVVQVISDWWVLFTLWCMLSLTGCWVWAGMRKSQGIMRVPARSETQHGSGSGSVQVQVHLTYRAHAMP